MTLTHRVQYGGRSDVIDSEPEPFQLELPVALLKVSTVVHVSLSRKYTVGGDGIGTV